MSTHLLAALVLLTQAGPWVADTVDAGPAHAQAPAHADHKAPAANASDAGTADAGVTLPEAAPLSVSAALTPARVTLGQPFDYTVTIRHDPADAYSLPADLVTPFAKTGIDSRGEPQVQRAAEPAGTTKNSEARTVFTLPLVVTGSMKPELPTLRLFVQGPAGPRQLTVAGQPIEIESLVTLEAQASPDRAHHGPKPPEPVWMRSWLWAGLLAALAAAAGAVLLLRKLRKQKAEEAARPPPPPLPHDIAFGRLKALRLRAPWQQGQGRAAIFELSEIVRVYLGQRLSFGAIDLTSDELLRELRLLEAAGLKSLEVAALEKQLLWEDLVKFARVEPTAEECLAAIDAGSALVERTQERMAKERHAELAGGASTSMSTGAGATAAPEARTTSPASTATPPPPVALSAGADDKTGPDGGAR